VNEIGWLLAAFGAHRLWLAGFDRYVRGHALRDERSISYDPILGFREKLGEPVVLVDRSFERTMFFFEGFRTQMAANFHRPWFETLHAEHRVNVIAPVLGLQSAPFALRNLPWDPRQDLRTALQVYDAHVSLLPKGHRVVVASACFGVLPALAIAARRRPDAVVLFTPVTTDFGPSATMPRWIRALLGSPLTPQIVPYYFRRKGLGGWDIVDPARREQAIRDFPTNKDWNLGQYFVLRRTLDWMEREIAPAVTGHDIFVATGEQDAFLPPAKVAEFADRLRRSGNRVEFLPVPGSGHMVLLDQGSEPLKARVLRALDGAPSAPAGER
jgi:pimeloyl-ACP methyl ester carboxylesterase